MLDEKICHCGKEMRVLKNGFKFVYHDDACVYTSDLWGCYECGRYAIYGIPASPLAWFPVLAWVRGEMTTQRAGSPYRAIRFPAMIFSQLFKDHIEEWYPDWPWEVPDRYGFDPREDVA